MLSSSTGFTLKLGCKIWLRCSPMFIIINLYFNCCLFCLSLFLENCWLDWEKRGVPLVEHVFLLGHLWYVVDVSLIHFWQYVYKSGLQPVIFAGEAVHLLHTFYRIHTQGTNIHVYIHQCRFWQSWRQSTGSRSHDTNCLAFLTYITYHSWKWKWNKIVGLLIKKRDISVLFVHKSPKYVTFGNFCVRWGLRHSS